MGLGTALDGPAEFAKGFVLTIGSMRKLTHGLRAKIKGRAEANNGTLGQGAENSQTNPVLSTPFGGYWFAQLPVNPSDGTGCSLS